MVILDNSAEIARVVADRYRQDLEEAGIGDGRHSFSCVVPGGLARDVWHRLEFYHATDWVPLTGAPIVVNPATTPLAA